MPVFTAPQRRFVQAVSGITHANPFLPQRIEYERQALGQRFEERASDWNVNWESAGSHPNITRLLRLAGDTLDAARDKLLAGVSPRDDELQLYEDLTFFVLYHEYREHNDETVRRMFASPGSRRAVTYFQSFEDRLNQYLRLPKVSDALALDAAHTLALFFQVRRAFFHIHGCLVGTSAPAAQLRAMVWQSIFTHDMRRYRRTLFDNMGQHTTLITGPSGTGKELVARAIALSRYIPFDAGTRRFAVDISSAFLPINLTALSPTLIESELFGHKRGAFTGAVSDRTGWLEKCPAHGAVFLDEIGDLDPVIQVKLLRVLQTRHFNRLGETDDKHFAGKLLAATNRDLNEAMAVGSFRQDFFYRLCSDQIATPSLAEQLADCPEDLTTLVRFLSQRMVGPDESERLTKQVVAWIDRHMGRDYPWPGNVRELEQCVRNVLIRNEYHPNVFAKQAADAEQVLAQQLISVQLTADELLDAYCKIAYAQLGSYAAAAKQLGVDRRTVKARIDKPLAAARPNRW